MINHPLKIDYNIILGSASPRRQLLLKELGLSFQVVTKDINEDYPPDLKCNEVATFLAEKKAAGYDKEIRQGHLTITADTIVCLEGQVIGKPQNKEEGIKMLGKLSGKKHVVISGVCIRYGNEKLTFAVSTDVYFRNLKPDEISYYVSEYNPIDKAGAYGIQEWIGLVAIEKINGSYHNVMGLPVAELYSILKTLD